MSIRWANLVEESKDKGPYKLAKVEADKHQFTVQIIDVYGIQGSPPKGSQVLVIPVDGDEGKCVGICMPPPKSRYDQLKPGEMKIGNHNKGSYTWFDADGNTQTVASGKHTEQFGGEHTEQIGADKRVTTGGIIYVNC